MGGGSSLLSGCSGSRVSAPSQMPASCLPPVSALRPISLGPAVAGSLRSRLLTTRPASQEALPGPGLPAGGAQRLSEARRAHPLGLLLQAEGIQLPWLVWWGWHWVPQGLPGGAGPAGVLPGVLLRARGLREKPVGSRPADGALLAM